MSITFSTCWYSLKAKFPETTYLEWMDNLLSSVHRYFLVLYTDQQNYTYFFAKYGENKKIKIIIRPFEEFYMMQHKDFWIQNHKKNTLLNQRVDWQVNMLWSEKVHFVENTRVSEYFPPTDWYGWIDIGYFRCRPGQDITKEMLQDFPKPHILNGFNPHKIHYALVNPNLSYIYSLMNLIQHSDQSIPYNQISIGGGCFIAPRNKVEEWKNTYTAKLEQYIQEGRLVKDDQIILADCIFRDIGLQNFELHFDQRVSPYKFDIWFTFAYLLTM